MICNKDYRDAIPVSYNLIRAAKSHCGVFLQLTECRNSSRMLRSIMHGADHSILSDNPARACSEALPGHLMRPAAGALFVYLQQQSLQKIFNHARIQSGNSKQVRNMFDQAYNTASADAPEAVQSGKEYKSMGE